MPLTPHIQKDGGWGSASSAFLFKIWSLAERTQGFYLSGPSLFLGLNLWEIRIEFFSRLNVTVEYAIFSIVKSWQACVLFYICSMWPWTGWWLRWAELSSLWPDLLHLAGAGDFSPEPSIWDQVGCCGHDCLPGLSYRVRNLCLGFQVRTGCQPQLLFLERCQCCFPLNIILFISK